MWKWIFFLFTPLFAVQIEIGGTSLEVEIAETQQAMEIGLSGRSKLPDNTGMLFIYKKPQILSFWMKDTLIPLSIGFFDANRVLLQTEEMVTLPPTAKKQTIYSSNRPSLYALEVPSGWFERRGIKPGMRFKFVKNAFPDQANPIK